MNLSLFRRAIGGHSERGLQHLRRDLDAEFHAATIVGDVRSPEQSIKGRPLRADLLPRFRVGQCGAAYPEEALQRSGELEGVEG